MLKKAIMLNIVLIFVLSVSVGVHASSLAPGFSDGSDNITSIPVLSSEPVVITDSTTGITLNIPAGALPPGVTSISFSVTKVDSSIVEAAQQFADDSGNGIKVNSVFDLTMLDQDSRFITNFNGAIEVTLPLTDDSNGVIYVNLTSGTIEIMPSKMQNGFITFTTTGFSYYALARIDSTSIPTVPGQGESSDTSSGGGTTSSKDNPQTADNNIVLFTMLAGLACIAVGTSIFVIKRNKV